MTKQSKQIYAGCIDLESAPDGDRGRILRMNSAGEIIRDLIGMNLAKPYDQKLNQFERRRYAGNIYYAIRGYRKVCKDNKDNIQFLSGTLGVDINDLEIKTWAIWRGITEDEARKIW